MSNTQIIILLDSCCKPLREALNKFRNEYHPKSIKRTYKGVDLFV